MSQKWLTTSRCCVSISVTRKWGTQRRKGMNSMNVSKLRGKMAEAGISQRKLSEITGIKRNTIWRVLKGDRQLNLKEAEAICEALNIVDAEEKVFIFLPGSPNIGSRA